MKAESIPREWLTVRLPSDDYLAACRADLAALGLDPPDIERVLVQTADGGRERWNEFLKQRSEGDELWLYRSSSQSWASLSGYGGFALVRAGEIVAAMNTCRS